MVLILRREAVMLNLMLCAFCGMTQKTRYRSRMKSFRKSIALVLGCGILDRSLASLANGIKPSCIMIAMPTNGKNPNPRKSMFPNLLQQKDFLREIPVNEGEEQELEALPSINTGKCFWLAY